MLRTAQEIIDECFEKADKDALVSEIYIAAVNAAREELLEECANSASLEYRTYAKYRGGCSIGTDMPEEYEVGVNQFVAINKQSILDLIHQIK